MNKQNSESKIDSLQAIRAFAAIIVMFFHGTTILEERLNYIFLNKIFIAGFSGVDIFFVLSGFIILFTSSTGKYNIKIFLIKRFIRIYPIYWLITTLLIFAYFISPAQEQSYKGNIEIILGSFILLPQQKYIVGVAWTLTYEIIFYLIFAVTYFKQPKYLFYVLSIWITTIAICFFNHIKSNSILITTLLNPLSLNFALGCLIAYLYKRYNDFDYPKTLISLGIILFLIMWTRYYQFKLSTANILTDDIKQLYFFGIPAGLIIFSVLYLPITVPKLLVYLGDASYSIYLIHGTVLSILIKLVQISHQSEIFSSLGGSIILFLGTILISCCFYSLVEKNLLKLLNKIYTTHQPEKIISLIK